MIFPLPIVSSTSTPIFANFAQLCFVHAADVDTRVFLDSVEHSDTFERSFEIDRVLTDFDLGSTVYVEADFSNIFSVKSIIQL